MSRKFLQTGLMKYVAIALLPGTALGVAAYTNGEAVAGFIEKLMHDETKKEQKAQEVYNQVTSRVNPRKGERMMYIGQASSSFFALRRNYHINEVLYNHMDEDAYVLSIQQYDEGLSGHVLPYMKWVHYASPEFIKKREESHSKRMQKSREERERIYAELEKKGLIDKV